MYYVLIKKQLLNLIFGIASFIFEITSNIKCTYFTKKPMSKTPEVYSIFNGLDVNYKVILGIFAGAILFQAGLEHLSDNSDPASYISSNALFLLELGITVFAFYMAYRYNFSAIFGRSFLFFGIGFLALVAGEILSEFNAIPEFVEIMPGAFIQTQSLSYFVLYGSLSTFLFINIYDLNAGFGMKNILLMMPIIAVLVGSFYGITYADYGTFDHILHYCGISVFGTSVVAAMSVVGVRILFKKTLGRAWRILMYGLLTFAVGDVVFHYYDTMSLYYESHFVNVFMYSAYMLIIYAMYKNVKVF